MAYHWPEDHIRRRDRPAATHTLRITILLALLTILPAVAILHDPVLFGRVAGAPFRFVARTTARISDSWAAAVTHDRGLAESS